MAPECLKYQTYSAASDCWAFGITLIEVYTRQAPYPDKDAVRVATTISSQEDSPVNYIPSHLSPPIAEILRACFSWKPEKRPSFEDLCLKLEQAFNETQQSNKLDE